MIKSRFIFIALLTFSIGSLFVYLFYLNSQKSAQKKTEIQFTPPNSQETKTEKPKVFDQNGEEVFWQGTSEGFKFRWTKKDIYVEKDGKTQRIFSKYADFLYNRQIPFLKSLKMNCSKSIVANILSVVGSIMTIEVNDSTFCVPSAHPSDEPLWIVVDLNKLNNHKFDKSVGNSIKITDIFSDKEVLNALLENQEINSAINEIDKNYKPKTAFELARWFRLKDETWDSDKVSYGGDTANFIMKGQLNEDSLYDFSFEKIEGDYVFVKIGLSPINRRPNLPTLSLKLKTPDKIKQNLELANTKQSGFLGENSINDYTSKDFEIGKQYRKQ